MRGVFVKGARSARAVLLAVAVAMIALQASGSAQQIGRVGEDASLTYISGQAVAPIFHGWLENPDGTFNLYFSYVNRNWQEHVDIPIGPNNNISPAPFGPDAGQPTHFFPRINRWQFAVRVPKDFGNKEIVWTLTTRGETLRAYGSLNPGYAVDEFLIMHEFANSERGHKWPILQVEGPKTRTVKVGQPAQLVAVATDPNPPQAAGRGGRGRAGGGGPAFTTEVRAGSVGGDFTRSTARGLRVVWYLYRGPNEVAAPAKVEEPKFDPPMAKVWEDQRGGTPFSPNFVVPPVPPGNRWVHNVTFSKPGTYVLRAQAHDGFLFDNEDITFTVTP
jgi:hypothetical protein